MAEEELNAPEKFYACNDEKCSTIFKYIDISVHTNIDGPDPRDHLANERNLLTWLRTGTTLSLIGFMSLIEMPTHKHFTQSQSSPWIKEVPSLSANTISYIFIALGFISIFSSLYNYFRNQYQIVNRLFWVGHGWVGLTVAILMMVFAVFVMVMALLEN